MFSVEHLNDKLRMLPSKFARCGRDRYIGVFYLFCFCKVANNFKVQTQHLVLHCIEELLKIRKKKERPGNNIYGCCDKM